MLFAKDTPGENIVVRGARVVDPSEGLDAVLDVRVDDGVLAALGQIGRASCRERVFAVV